jgi:CBS domain-containing protein
MIIEDVISFLKKVPPFQFLSEEELQGIALNLTMEFYPKDTLILRQGDKNIDALRIIKRGAVKVFIKNVADDDIVVDYRGEGDNFGLWSIVSDEGQKTNVIATEDTICYLLNKDKVLWLLDKNAVFTEYFLKSHLAKYADRTYREMHNKSLFYGGSDRILFTTQIGDIGARTVITVKEDVIIQEAAQIMANNKISSLIILDEKNIPIGIVTDRDLREKVVAKGRDVNEPVANIMSLPLIGVDAKDYCFEAIFKMIKHNIHHILVIKEANLKGVITNHDLMLLQGASPLAFSKDIESQQTVEGLVPVSKKINMIIGLLLRQGASASNITKIIAELNDRLVRKILEIAERKFGHPPVPYCWIAYGSEGRKEQTFKTDQDNAIIYSEESEDAERYFAELALFVRDSLLRCGFPLCPADYMASNSKWRQPIAKWKRYFYNWINDPTPDAILKSLIFFDFRPIYGNFGIADDLRIYLAQAVKGQEHFFAEMADAITKNRPPLSILKRVIVEKSGEHKNELNLKIRGLVHIVDIARIFAIEAGISETSTIDRIRLAKDEFPVLKRYADALEEAFEFISLLRIYHQIEQLERGEQLDNYINPEKLSGLKKKTLKESFNLIAEVQDSIIKRYVPEFLRG